MKKKINNLMTVEQLRSYLANVYNLAIVIAEGNGAIGEIAVENGNVVLRGKSNGKK